MPQLLASAVARQRLVERLVAGMNCRLSTLVAPAGFGKTTLARQWADSAASLGRKVAWVRLDKGDDARRLWAHIATALGVVESDVTQGLGVVDALVNELSVLDESFMLILDDYHDVADLTAHDILAYFVAHLPQNLHLAIISRQRLPIPLARLRSQGQLSEFTMFDLAFTVEEAAQLFAGTTGTSLAPEDLACLMEKTEGWAAGICMAAQKAVSPSSQFCSTAASVTQICIDFEDFRGDTRQLDTYFGEELLRGLDPDLQSFLARSSLLTQMTAGLCDQVLGRSDSKAILDILEGSGLFVLPAGERREWLRYHPLFREFLKSRLDNEDPGELVRMHTEACLWLERHALYSEAVPHALAASDYQRVVSEIELAATRPVFSTDVLAIERSIWLLPEGALEQNPRMVASLFMMRAALCERKSLEGAIGELDQLCTDCSDLSLDTRIALCVAACIKGDYDRALDLYGNLDIAEASEPSLFQGVYYYIHLAFLAKGRLDDAVNLLVSTSRRIAKEQGLHAEYVSAVCTIARIYRYRGWLRESLAVYQDALEYAGRHSMDARVLALIQAGIGDIYREQGQLDIATLFIQGARRQYRPERIHTMAWNYTPDYLLILARNALARHDVEQADAFIKQANESIERYYRIPFLVAEAQAHRLRYWIDSGDKVRVTTWADEVGLRLERGDRVTAVERMSFARACLSLGRTQEALDILDSIHEGNDSGSGLNGIPDYGEADSRLPVFEFRIEIRLLKARALYRMRCYSAAESVLLQALRLAEPEGFLQVFANEGAELKDLLWNSYEHLSGSRIRSGAAPTVQFSESVWCYCRAYWDSIAEPDIGQAVTTAHARSQHGDLSPRELEVLRLMAAGRDVREISGQLYLSVHTTRTHIKNIYQKLDVHSREEAAQKALFEGLM
jgi:LuxR family maltose regulon positive regulatory protein